MTATIARRCASNHDLEMLAARMDVLCSNLASDVVLAIGTMAIVQMAVIDALLIAFFL